MIETPVKTLTLKEFLALSETKRASEFIDDQIIQKSIPQGKHSRIQGELTTYLNLIAKPNKIRRGLVEQILQKNETKLQ